MIVELFTRTACAVRVDFQKTSVSSVSVCSGESAIKCRTDRISSADRRTTI